MADIFTNSAIAALQNYNSDYGTSYEFGNNWDSTGSMFETFINRYLFPKINETALINVDLGNRFDFLAREQDFIGQYSEDYVILDSVPISMNLTKNEELMLKRNYPKIATKLYGTGIVKKQKFTLNNNDVRLNFLTLGDAVKYALAVYKKRISDINVAEEKEVKAMIIDYALNVAKDVRTVTSRDDLFTEVYQSLLNIQNNNHIYNEANLASGGALGRYTTVTRLSDVAILTNDNMKTFLLDTKLANTFQVDSLDISNRIISFDDLGGIYKLTDDVEVTSPDTVEMFRVYNDYQIEIGDIIPEGAVITFDVTELAEFVGNIEEVKPESDLFAYVFDINKIRYRRNTKDMLKTPFYNGEFDEITYWIHYYSFKAISPFFNSVRIGG